MFTGLIEEKGELLRTDIYAGKAGSIEIKASFVLDGMKIGDSISISGVCLTVIEVKGSSFVVEVMPETLRRTKLGGLNRGDPLNLERALALGGRMGGHMVNGHVDGVGIIDSRKETGNAVLFEIKADSEVTRYLSPKGSVALDGISLTVVEVKDGRFTVSIIPHTSRTTTLKEARAGDRVNIEVDIIAKYVEKAVGTTRRSTGDDSMIAILSEANAIEEMRNEE